MRMILGLDAPTTGNVDGQRQGLPRPAGAAARGRRDARGARHPHRAARAYNHLLAMAQTHGIPRSRVDEVIELVGLAGGRPQARRRASRWAWASGWASPRRCSATRPTVILDEPANGLDPEGILWIRNLLKGLAADGRTVFLSSHLMSEIALTAEHLIVDRARPADRGHDRRRHRRPGLRVRRGARPLARRDAAARRAGGGRRHGRQRRAGLLEVHGLASERIGEIAAQHGLVLHELTPLQASLEDAFMSLTGDAVEYHAGAFDVSTTGLETAA